MDYDIPNQEDSYYENGNLKYERTLLEKGEIIKKATKAFEEGDYRWVVQVMNHAVFADPTGILWFRWWRWWRWWTGYR